MICECVIFFVLFLCIHEKVGIYLKSILSVFDILFSQVGFLFKALPIKILDKNIIVVKKPKKTGPKESNNCPRHTYPQIHKLLREHRVVVGLCQVTTTIGVITDFYI